MIAQHHLEKHGIVGEPVTWSPVDPCLACQMDASYEEVLAQTSRRTTVLEMNSYRLDTERQRREWRTLLSTIEQRLILGNKHVGMLADDLSDYLYVRTTGHIGSLMELIRRGCTRAIRTGAETLNYKLLDAVKIDSADLGGAARTTPPQPGPHHGRTAGRAAFACEFGDR